MGRGVTCFRNPEMLGRISTSMTQRITVSSTLTGQVNTCLYLLLFSMYLFLVGKNLIANMLPTLCEAVGQPRATNHSVRYEFDLVINSDSFLLFRVTAIKYMRRSGMDWLTIAKITGVNKF